MVLAYTKTTAPSATRPTERAWLACTLRWRAIHRSSPTFRCIRFAWGTRAGFRRPPGAIPGRSGTPPFTQARGDYDVPAVAPFTRRSWGNDAVPVTETEGARLRGVPAD